jgi:DNA-binding response OmpR family regulator
MVNKILPGLWQSWGLLLPLAKFARTHLKYTVEGFYIVLLTLIEAMPENRILLVEDDPTTREIITELLRGEGYNVDSVATAGAALTCFKAITYALVIADRMLPDGDGIGIADTAMELGCKTMIITGYLEDLPTGSAERHQLFGKPLNPGEIIAATREAIGRPAAQPR